MTLRCAAVVPPMMLRAELMRMPLAVFARAVTPLASIPIQQPSITFPPPDEISMPLSLKRLMTRPRSKQLLVVMRKPSVEAGVPVPFNSISGAPAKPGCVVPSMVSGSVIAGSRLMGNSVSPEPPPMLKSITSTPAAAFASVIAWRNEPAPVSFVTVTVKVAACASPGSKVRRKRRMTFINKREQGRLGRL